MLNPLCSMKTVHSLARCQAGSFLRAFEPHLWVEGLVIVASAVQKAGLAEGGRSHSWACLRLQITAGHEGIKQNHSLCK